MIAVKAVVTGTPPTGGGLTELLSVGLDPITGLLGRDILLELVSSELDPGKRFKDEYICMDAYIYLQVRQTALCTGL